VLLSFYFPKPIPQQFHTQHLLAPQTLIKHHKLFPSSSIPLIILFIPYLTTPFTQLPLSLILRILPLILLLISPPSNPLHTPHLLKPPPSNIVLF
ncbi:ArsB/NhaD family transporter, partial [Staphylococcus pettenkoferi]|uniref:ArsB/NhaD family transporter n=1 Tax=Staphylococcus pettenkoferi TaxID=170573 RepID=UPI003B97268D